MTLTPEELRQRIDAAGAHARHSGALRPIPTRMLSLRDTGIDFIVRLIQRPAGTARPARPVDPLANPFLPYEHDLYVADLSPSHVAILNKYNVFDRHLLIITRAYHHQQEWLAMEDFAALLPCMAAFPSMGFYNAGRAAGASQMHKHLQVVPLPLGSEGPSVPVQPLIEAAGLSAAPGRVAGLPYAHAAARLDPAWLDHPHDGAAQAFAVYRALVTATGLDTDSAPHAGAPGPPYNLVVLRDWMMLVPRTRETFCTITVNSLGVAGALLVKDEERLRLLQRRGPAAALRYVTR